MVQITIREQPFSNFEKTSDTIKEMWQATQRDALDWDIICTARDIVDAVQVNPRSPEETGDAIFWWVKENIEFFRDPWLAEMLQTPRRLLQTRRGDCDCMTMFAAALNLAIGNNVRFVTISANEPNRFSHVYYEVAVMDKWKSYDVVNPDSYPGWEPPTYYNKCVWYIDNRNEQLSGFFDKILKEIKRVARRVEKEIKRTARRIKAERDRFTEKINAEFQRWEKKLGPFGKILVVGAKVSATLGTAGIAGFVMAPVVAPIGVAYGGAVAAVGVGGAGAPIAIAGGAIPSTIMVSLQATENPFKLTEEEWKFLAQLSMTLSSAILTIVGSGAPLLVGSILSFANTAVSVPDVIEEIEQRKDMLEKLKAEKARFVLEERIHREAIRKLETDIMILEKIVEKQAQYTEATKDFMQKMDEFLLQTQDYFGNLADELFTKYKKSQQNRLDIEKNKLDNEVVNMQNLLQLEII